MDELQNPTNDLNAAVTKFCLYLEKDRRTPEGRIRSEHDFRQHFFPYDETSARDRVLKFMPREVRGPIIASWGIRGHKAAMRDDDARVRSVVHDAFVAGDIDDTTFEEGISADLIIGWAELADWWKFYRGGKHSKYSIQRALEIGYDLGLFDAKWFFDILESGGGKLHGTDVLVEGMSKTELADWIKKIHESGDGSPRGMLTALGWSTLVAKTSNAVLLSAIDAFAAKNSLVKEHFRADEDEVRTSASRPSERPETDGSSRTEANALGVPGAAPTTPPAAIWSDPLNGVDSAPVKDDAVLSPPDDALLKELESPSPMEEGDWLENPVSVASEPAEDLDVELEGHGDVALEDPGEVTQLFERPSDEELAQPAEGAPEQPHGVAASISAMFRNKATLPGLPSSAGKKGKTVPPPLPEKGRK